MLVQTYSSSTLKQQKQNNHTIHKETNSTKTASRNLGCRDADLLKEEGEGGREIHQTKNDTIQKTTPQKTHRSTMSVTSLPFMEQL